MENAIQNEISHIQIHHPRFKEDQEVQFSLDTPERLLMEVEQIEGVKSSTVRTIVNGMIASSHGVRGIQISGIIPEQEAAVTHLAAHLVEGEYLNEESKTGILISKKTAERLNLKLRKKVALRFQDGEYNLIDAGFRVVGIFETKNTAFDEAHAYVLRDQLNKNLDMGNIAHEVAILLYDIEDIDSVEARLKSIAPDLLVESYKVLAPEIELFNSQIQISTTIFTFIVMLGLIFGIINTMLMAVLERFRELGMLMSIGMNKRRIFAMIVMETIMLGLIATPVGLLIGLITMNRLSRTGIDLSKWSSGMKEFGISEIVYPDVTPDVFFQLAFAVFLTAFLASLYPAFKAIQLKPVEAIRKI
ncbi:MAG: ABC transporter permease [Saprospiraceae bacterium]|nr:ABC transporter permease [Saprospiraceae bacterium]